MEIFDVVDKNDIVIGKATREECHSNPALIHHTVHFTLIDKKNKKVLLTQRSFKVKFDAGKICFIGEHIFSGESYKEALKRGVQEELSIIPSSFVEANHHIFQYDKQRELVRFFVVYWNGEEIKFDSREIEKIFWVDIPTLLKQKADYSQMTRYWVTNVDWYSPGPTAR